MIRINLDKFNTLNTLYGSIKVLKQVMQVRLAYLEQQVKSIQQQKRQETGRPKSEYKEDPRIKSIIRKTYCLAFEEV